MKFVFSLSFMFLAFVANAQSPKTTWGNFGEDIISLSYNHTGNAEYRYAYYSSEKEFTIFKTSLRDFKLAETKKIKTPVINEKPTDVWQILLVDNKLLAFSLVYDKKAKQQTVYAGFLNEGSWTFSDMKPIDQRVAKSDPSEFSLRLQLTGDKKHVLLYHQDNAEHAPASITCKLINSKLELAYDRKVDLAYPSDESSISTEVAEHNGKIYLTAQNLPDPARAVGKRMYFASKVICYDYINDKLQEQEINVEDKLLFDFKFGFLPNGQVVFAGMYATESVLKNYIYFDYRGDKIINVDAVTEGIFCYQFNADCSSVLSKDIKSLVAEFPKDKLKHQSMKSLSLMDNGDVVVVNEYRFITYTMQGAERFFNYDNFDNNPNLTFGISINNIYITRFNLAARNSVASKITKTQDNFGMQNYYSCQTLSDGKDLFVIVNGDKANVKLLNISEKEIELDDFPDIKKGATYIIRANNKGHLEAKDYYTDEQLMVVTRWFYPISDSEALITAEHKFDRKYGKISVK